MQLPVWRERGLGGTIVISDLFNKKNVGKEL